MIYLYAVCAITIIVFLIGAVTISNLLMERYIFRVESSAWCDKSMEPPESVGRGNIVYDSYEACVTRQNYNFKRDMSRGISMVLISLLLFIPHWRIVRKL